MSLCKDFLWGVATSSYQIEGAAFEDGKGLSIWDTMCQKPGVIWKGQSGAVASDHYHRYREDVALMAQMGLRAYRFSVSWPRILPAGTGAINDRGLAFYDRLIDELLAHNIKPYLTLYHWDLPQDLYCQGGWLNPESPRWFADYAKVLVDKFSDRVQHWITFNEPQSFIGLGYMKGEHAPGERHSVGEFLQVSHHVLLAHGRAVQTIREHAKRPCQIGYAPVGVVKMPAANTPANIDLARRETFAVKMRNWENNTWWMDPVYLGHYPEDGLALFGKDVPHYTDRDMEIISQPLDNFCINIYNGREIQTNDHGQTVDAPRNPGYPRTTFGWGVTPECMYWGMKFFYERYRKPIMVMENGMSNIDWVALDGRVHDPQRMDFLCRYLRELRRAVQEGVDVRGYFVWTLLDNFEWVEGYSKRFGLIHVDFETQVRTLKDSAYWYKKVIATNGDYLSEHQD